MMWVGLERMYLVPPGELVVSLFKASRDLTAKVVTLRTLRYSFGCPDEDLTAYRADDSGIGAKPLPGFEGFDPSARLFHIQHRDLQTMLMGTPLNVMTERFIGLFIRRLEATDRVKPGDEWTTIPDLYDFLKTEMFRAALTALCGTAIFDVAPDVGAHFWAFDASIATLFKRIPRIFARKQYAARDTVLEDVRKWHAHARANFDWNDKEAVDAEWEPLYGARLMRARQVMWDGIGQSEDGRAANDLGMMWA